MGKMKFDNDGLTRVTKCALLELASLYSLSSFNQMQLFGNIFSSKEKLDREQHEMKSIFLEFVGADAGSLRKRLKFTEVVLLKSHDFDQ